MKGLKTGLVALACLALAGCGTGQVVPVQAVQGGGLLNSRPSDVNSKGGVVDSAPALTIEVTNFCNGQAQVDYAWLVGFCGGSPAYSTSGLLALGGTSIPSSVGQLTGQAKSAWCQSNLWTGPSGQLSVPVDSSKNPIIPALANCPSGVAPAPVTAPTGAAVATKG